MIFIAGISIALFISALLLVKKEKSRSDVFLFLWMLLNALSIALFYIHYTGEIYNYPHLLGLQFPLPLLHGVLLYYYVSSVTDQFPAKKIIALVHLLPATITLIYLTSFFNQTAERKIEIFKSEGAGYEVFQMVLLIAIFLAGIIYVVRSSRLLQRHKKSIRNQFSDIEEINLRWLQFLTYGLGLVWCLVIFTQNDIWIYTGVSVFVIFIGFFGVQQKDIFTAKTSITKESNIHIKENDNVTKPKGKYINSGLSDDLAIQQYEKLNQLMTDEKFYTKPELSLGDLASKLDIHPNYLSQIINEKEGKSFYDYINTYRIDEFKRLIAIPKNQQYTLMALAYDCGFNSKSSFNRYFKKITGQTPSQYVKGIGKPA